MFNIFKFKMTLLSTKSPPLRVSRDVNKLLGLKKFQDTFMTPFNLLFSLEDYFALINRHFFEP